VCKFLVHSLVHKESKCVRLLDYLVYELMHLIVFTFNSAQPQSNN
jgi:hypothetical protein